MTSLKKLFNLKDTLFVIGISAAVVGFFLIFWNKNQEQIKNQSTPTISKNSLPVPTNNREENTPKKIASIQSPAIVRGIYVSGWSAGTKGYIAYLLDLVKTTSINTIVLDIKDSSGHISYKSKNSAISQYGAESNRIGDIDALIEGLHKQNLYIE